MIIESLQARPLAAVLKAHDDKPIPFGTTNYNIPIQIPCPLFPLIRPGFAAKTP